MPERWERKLRRFKDVPVPLDDIARKVTEVPPAHELSDEAQPRHRLTAGIAAFVIFGLAVSLFVVPMLRARTPGGTATSQSPTSSSATPAPLDPAAICAVPVLDRSVALLVGGETVQYPKSVLEGDGEPGATIQGPATDALRAYLASVAAVNFPADGWRAIASSPDAVTFAAPHPDAAWWVVGFALRDGEWRRVQEEIVDQQPTPAQRGEGLSLRWTGDVAIRQGGWNDPLELVNDRSTTWTDQAAAYSGLAHVFDPATGVELGSDPYNWGTRRDYSLDPGAAATLPVALGGGFSAYAPGTYAVVACVPDLGLASPVGTLNVLDDARATDVYLITYRSNGLSMSALGGGTLGVKNGCLGFGISGSRFIYLLLPEGYAVVERDGRTVLIGPTGDEVAAVGDPAEFGGGFTSLPKEGDAGAGWGISVPEACREGGGYFLAGGPA